MSWKPILAQIYFLVVLGVLAVCGLKSARAGHVRQLEITPDVPGVVHLAFGRTTAISFSVRPEKVVPGSPQAIEVNFLGKDITVRPLSSKAGNLLVYTKTSRFVLLFQVGGESQYDDVVKVAPAFSKRPLKLLQDAFRIVTLRIAPEKKDSEAKPIEVPAMFRSDDKEVHGSELKDALQPYLHLVCRGCVIRRDQDELRLTCSAAIETLHCTSAGLKLLIQRGPS